MQAAIPIYSEQETFYAPSFEIKAKGNLLPKDVVRDVMQVSYVDDVEQIDSFTLTINNWDAEQRRPKYVGFLERPRANSPEAANSAMFEPNKEIELYMGYHGNLRLMMSGTITTMEPSFPQSGPSTLTVRGLNVLSQFRRKQYSWKWPEYGEQETRDSDIATSLSRQPDQPRDRPGLGIEVRIDAEAANKEPREPYVLMDNQYPILFLMERARLRGYTLFVHEDPPGGRTNRYLAFGPTENLRDVTYRLDWGKSLLHFRPVLATAPLVSKVTVCGWNRRKKTRIEETATVGDDGLDLNGDLHDWLLDAGRHEVISDRPVETPEQASKMAKSVLSNLLKKMVQASGATIGLPDLRAGRMIQVESVDFRCNGHYFVSGTTHTINDSGYTTTFRARREQREGRGA